MPDSRSGDPTLDDILAKAKVGSRTQKALREARDALRAERAAAEAGNKPADPAPRPKGSGAAREFVRPPVGL